MADPLVDVCFLKSTGEGLGLADTGLDWAPGDEVATYDQEFPSVVYPWLGLASKKVSVRSVRDRRRFRFDAGDVAELLGSRTRVVCMSMVNFSNGFPAPGSDLAAVSTAGNLAGCRRRAGSGLSQCRCPAARSRLALGPRLQDVVRGLRESRSATCRLGSGSRSPSRCLAGNPLGTSQISATSSTTG